MSVNLAAQMVSRHLDGSIHGLEPDLYCYHDRLCFVSVSVERSGTWLY